MRQVGVQLFTFGGFRILADSLPVPPPVGRASREVLVYLVLAPERQATRDRLVGALWPEESEPSARKKLSQAVWRANSAFRDHVPKAAITADGGRLTLDIPELWCDATEVLAHADAAGLKPIERSVALEQVVHLISGPFLEGHPSRWVGEMSASFEAQLGVALRELIQLHRNQGDPAAAVRHARRLVRLEPNEEQSQLLLTEVLADLGRFEEARAALTGARQRAAETNMKPSQRLKRLERRVQQGAGHARQTPGGRLLFVGRDRVRSSILEHLDRSTQAMPTVLVEADPGMGKTRLAEEVLGDLRWRGWEILAATALSPTDKPFSPFAVAFADTLTPARTRLLAGRVDGLYLGAAAGAIDSFGAITAPRPDRLEGTGGQHRVSEAIAKVVEGLALDRPVVLIIDDVHLADQETLRTLHQLPQLIEGNHVAVLLTYRPREARLRPEVWTVIEAFDRNPSSLRLALEPLAPEDTASLVKAAVPEAPDSLISSIHALSGGSPLSITEVVRTLGSDSTAAPAELRSALMTRIDDLDGDSKKVLQFASVFDGDVPMAALIGGTNMTGEQILTSVESLHASGLLQPKRTSYEFSHALVREAVYEAIPASERPALHSAAASVLAEVGAHPASIGAQAEAAGDRVGASHSFVVAAREAAATSAYAVAAEMFGRALALIEPGDTGEIDVLHEYDDVLDLLGRHEERYELLERVRTHAQPPTSASGEVAWRVAQIEGADHDYLAAVEWARLAQQRARGINDDALLSKAKRTEGQALLRLGNLAAAVEAVEDSAETAPDPIMESEALLLLGGIYADQLDYRAAERVTAKALFVAEKAGNVPNLCNTLNMFGSILMEVGDTSGAQRHFDRSIELARTIGFAAIEVFALANSGMVAYIEGRPSTAARYMGEAADRLRSLGRLSAEARTRGNLGQVLVDMVGDVAGGEQQAHRELEIATSIGDQLAICQAHDVLGRVARTRDDLAEARARLETSVAIAGEVGVEIIESQALQQLALVEIDGGRFARALEVLERALKMSEEAEAGAMAPLMRATRGYAHLQAGKPEEALLELRVATDAVGSGATEACQIDYWHHLAATAVGLPDEAQEALTRANRRLETIRNDFGEEWPRVQHRVALYGAIEAAWEATIARSVTTRLGSRAGSAGTNVTLILGPEATDPVARRRLLKSVIDQCSRVGVTPTADELARLLSVSPRTVRRDLSQLEP